MEFTGDGYCYTCGAWQWRKLNEDKMCATCYDRWLVDYYAKPAAKMARCDIS